MCSGYHVVTCFPCIFLVVLLDSMQYVVMLVPSHTHLLFSIIMTDSELCLCKKFKIIRIYHECEGRIENIPPEDHWRHLTCRLMPNNDGEGQIFRSHHNTNNGLFCLAHS